MPFKNKYIDFHTHNSVNSDVIEIISEHFDENFILNQNYFTLGRHPWWSDDLLTNSEKELFLKHIKSEFCLGIGEIGLDKLKGCKIETQIQIFRELLKIASENKKSVVIHCVRAFDKLIELKNEFPKIKNWCIHGFSRHTELANQLINKGFYLSLRATKNPTQKYVELVKNIPIKRLFLETDDTEIKIEDIYLQVSEIKEITVEELQIQIGKNFNSFFIYNDNVL